MNGEQNLRLIREIEANRMFLLAAYRQNPALLERAEQRIKDLVGFAASPTATESHRPPVPGAIQAIPAEIPPREVPPGHE